MADKGDEEIKVFLKQYPGIFQVIDQEDRKKFVCKLTQHEIPYSLKSIENYTSGKKFQNLFSKVKSIHTIDKVIEGPYKEYFLPSRKSKSCLFCTLTKKEINNLPHEIEQHVTGYRFKKAYFLKKEAEKPGLNCNGQDQKSPSKETEISIPDFVLNSDVEDNSENNEDDNESVDSNLVDTCEINECTTVPNFKQNKKLIKKMNSNDNSPVKKKRKATEIDNNCTTKLKKKNSIDNCSVKKKRKATEFDNNCTSKLTKKKNTIKI
ncbi:uncharacterized protein LOC105843600 [Hydra vulgaris]|uniref:uncharacterized protein LOC105843600 n=1 Tax=Hydra vulgaris TaxID=6087 RepID=UPI001F5E8803|nr:uncharacterized protein LOC105843600 [Hydra vulgaris]